MQCPQGSNREPSLARWGEGHGRGEALGNAAPKNPAAYGTWNGGRVVVGTGETRLRPSSETAREADRAGGLGATNPISGQPDEVGESGAGVGGGHSSDEGVDNRTRRSEGPLAECAAQRRGSGIAARLFTRGTTSRRDGCWDAGPTPVAGRNVARRLLGGEPCAGEPHARFREGRLETEPPRPPRQSPTLQRGSKSRNLRPLGRNASLRPVEPQRLTMTASY